MKLSKYNLYVPHNDNLIIYNTFSGGILELDEPYKSCFLSYQQNDTKLSDELKSTLCQGEMLIDNTIDETKRLKVLHNMEAFDNQTAAFTIAPTLECNFRCPYCYEAGHQYHTMNHSVIAKTIEFINEFCKDRKALSITWYGGEPLLQLPIIKQITEQIEKKHLTYDAAIVTNGYYLTREKAELLRELGVIQAQITIDGPPEIHNQRRRLPNGADTFYRILDNIEACCDIIPISIRINVDTTNIETVNEIIKHFKDRNIEKKVYFYLAPVTSINESSCSNCLSNLNFSQKQVEFMKTHMDEGISVYSLPECSPSNCGAVCANSFIIDPLGDLYKCWDEIGLTDKKSGSIFDPDSLSERFLEWIDYPFVYYSDCKECELFPICLSGCAYLNMESGKMQCHALKCNVNDMVLLRKKQQEQYEKNR